MGNWSCDSSIRATGAWLENLPYVGVLHCNGKSYTVDLYLDDLDDLYVDDLYLDD